MLLKLSILLSCGLIVLAVKEEEDAPFSIGLGTLAPSYRQKFGPGGRIQYDFKQEKNGFSFTLGDSKAPSGLGGLGAIPADFSKDLLSIKVPVSQQETNAINGQGDIRQSAQTQHASPYVGAPGGYGGGGAGGGYGGGAAGGGGYGGAGGHSGGYAAPAPTYHDNGGYQQNHVASHQSYGGGAGHQSYAGPRPNRQAGGYGGHGAAPAVQAAPQPDYQNIPFPSFQAPSNYGAGIPGQAPLSNPSSVFNIFSNHGGAGGAQTPNLAAAAFSGLSGIQIPGQGQGGHGGGGGGGGYGQGQGGGYGGGAAPSYNDGQYHHSQHNSGQYNGGAAAGQYSALQRSGLSAGVPSHHTAAVSPYSGYGGQPRPQFLQQAAQGQAGHYGGGAPAYGGAGGGAPVYGGAGGGAPVYGGGGGGGQSYGGPVHQPNLYNQVPQQHGGAQGGFNPPQFRTAQAAIASLAQLQDPRQGGGQSGGGHGISFTTNLYHQFQQAAQAQAQGQGAPQQHGGGKP